MMLTCTKCQGEGSLYTSRYGGNDPDVWRTGACPLCNGRGNEPCGARGCRKNAAGFNEDGEALCDSCLAEWIENTYGDPTP